MPNESCAASPDAPPLHLERVSRRYGGTEAVREVSLTVHAGEFVALLGPSGCGKTTLLSLLSGHDTPTGGTVTRHGRARTVYQQGGLFPWMTVADNIRLGLRDLPEQQAQAAELETLLRLVGLEGFRDHYPHQLSGGMQQRAELARAMAGSSDILLMDEPFSALDYLTRLRMRQELTRLLHERPRTVVFVTHDIEEAAQLADRVIVLTERPARIQNEIRIETPRPRSLTHPSVIEAMQRILSEMGLETPDSRARPGSPVPLPNEP